MVSRFCLSQAQKNQLWLYTLLLNEEPAAIWLGFSHNNTLLYYQGGWDERFSEHGVGTILMHTMIEKAIEAKMSHFSFLRGDERYKRSFTPTGESTLRLRARLPR